MMFRMLLVFLLLIGAGTAVGQQALVPQANDQFADDPEEPKPPAPKDPEPPVPAKPDEEAPDEDIPEETLADEEMPREDPAAPGIEQPVDEQDGEQAAILDVIESFVLAFNQGDAQTLAAHWTEQGDFVTAEGERWQGREQIETRYGEYFAQVEGARLELEEVHIEVQSPSVAVETGTARVIEPGRTPREFEYSVIHVKTAEGWKIDSVREVEVLQPPGRDELMQQLDWMVGQWVDQDGHADIRTTCRWATNRSFLVQTFRVYAEGRIDFEGTQIIGWDPRAQTIRSWLFDSDGGFGVGRWSGSEGRWTVPMLQILPDGRIGSATNLYERTDDGTVTYRSVGRQVDGAILPNVDPVTFIRTMED